MTKMLSRSALHTLKTSVIIHTFFKIASDGEVNVVFFMEEVQKYDCLYNKYSKSYKDKYIKINCWTKIGEKFDMSAADAEKKSKNVRTGYGRYLKKVKAIPSGVWQGCCSYTNFALKCCHSPQALLPS